MSQNILPDIIQDIPNKTLAQFELKYTGWYLFGGPAAEDEGAISYQTDVIDAGTLRKMLQQCQTNSSLENLDQFDDDHAQEDRFVLEIKKKPNKAFAEWITVGRAMNNDIVLRYPTVSKLHARLEIETTGFGDPIGFKLIDNNSTGKTVHNGKILQPESAVPLSIGDQILFGNINSIVIDSATLWHKLR